jgi:hypothetical protein
MLGAGGERRQQLLAERKPLEVLVLTLPTWKRDKDMGGERGFAHLY